MKCATCGTKVVTKLRWKPGPVWFHAKGADLPDLHAPEPKWTVHDFVPVKDKELFHLDDAISFMEDATGLLCYPDPEDRP